MGPNQRHERVLVMEKDGAIKECRQCRVDSIPLLMMLDERRKKMEPSRNAASVE
jgi:hypothetical protein